MDNKQTAQYIYQILTSKSKIFGSWGVDEISTTEYEKMYGLKLNVNGFIHQGEINVVYNVGADYFEVFLFGKNGEVKEHRVDVYFDELVSVVDEMIETGNMSEEKYQEKIKNWLNEID